MLLVLLQPSIPFLPRAATADRAEIPDDALHDRVTAHTPIDQVQTRLLPVQELQDICPSRKLLFQTPKAAEKRKGCIKKKKSEK